MLTLECLLLVESSEKSNPNRHESCLLNVFGQKTRKDYKKCNSSVSQQGIKAKIESLEVGKRLTQRIG